MARVLLLLALAVAAVATSTPAPAVTGGAPDVDHAYAGALVVDGRVACSGVLVAPSVFLTARHCVAAEGQRVAVAFGERLDPASWTLRPGVAHVHPVDDVAAVVLDAPVRDVAPAALAGEGAAAGVTSVVAVGYGYHDRVGGEFLYDGLRRSATVDVKKHTPSALILSSRDGGVCFGDSGGPLLAGDTVVALTSAGRRSCNGPAEAYRVDTPQARAFLAGFVALP